MTTDTLEPPAGVAPERPGWHAPRGSGAAGNVQERHAVALPSSVAILALHDGRDARSPVAGEVAGKAPEDARLEGSAGSGGERRRRLRWVGWISRRVFHG